MEDKIVIGIVVILALVAHVWIFKWVRFKIDEGVIMKFLHESSLSKQPDTAYIASKTDITEKRVSHVLHKSNIIKNLMKDNYD